VFHRGINFFARKPTKNNSYVVVLNKAVVRKGEKKEEFDRNRALLVAKFSFLKSLKMPFWQKPMKEPILPKKKPEIHQSKES